MLIIDMPMPKGCTWTDENENGQLCPLLDIDCDCVLQEKGIKIGWAEQYAKCPIKGVLPETHGDLIDRDALKEKKVYSHERHEYVVPVACIDWKDAVIAAERSKT